jgi:hypothetical protein
MRIRAFIPQHQDFLQGVFYMLIIISLWLAEYLICPAIPDRKLSRALLNCRFIFTTLPVQLLLASFVLLIMNRDHRHNED